MQSIMQSILIWFLPGIVPTIWAYGLKVSLLPETLPGDIAREPHRVLLEGGSTSMR